MQKIAILTCLQSAENYCTGAACFSALDKRSGAFRRYEEEDLKLVAFFHCNGCHDKNPEQCSGMNEKIDRILKIKPDAVHLGVCTLKDTGRCGTIQKMARIFRDHGIQIINGTHSSPRLENIGVELYEEQGD